MGNWLDWKLKHGLAYRGRPAPLKPRGAIAKVLYAVYFKHREVATPENERGGRVFKQNVGGSVGALGKVNGE